MSQNPKIKSPNKKYTTQTFGAKLVSRFRNPLTPFIAKKKSLQSAQTCHFLLALPAASVLPSSHRGVHFPI